MRLTIQCYKREPVDPPHSGFRSVPDGTLTGTIVLSIDEAKLTRLMGPRALRSKRFKSTMAGGAIVARVVDPVREGGAK